jgi:predicted nucleotidyltransferase
MKVVGLITEYNPFHNGHEHHLLEAKRITGADYVVVVMSGDFTQRGAPALIDKYSRTQMALKCGADLVFELPVCYSTASAEFFALGAVSLLDKLGIVDEICFGSECGDTKILSQIARILIDEPQEYKLILNHELKKGVTYPVARMEAIKSLYPDIDSTILSSPNNILGIEYIKAILRIGSSIKPITITRKLAGYHDEDLTEITGPTISSATAIRKSLDDTSDLDNLKNHIPKEVYKILNNNYKKTFPIKEKDFSLLLNYKLMQETEISLLNYIDVTNDLANRILSFNFVGSTFSSLSLNIKSKQWTLTRVNRVLFHILLNLYMDNFKQYNQNGYTQYARILGFKKSSSSLLRAITKNEGIPVITKLADAKHSLTNLGLVMLQEDIFATHLYNQVVFHKFGTLLKDEYTHGIVISQD